MLSHTHMRWWVREEEYFLVFEMSVFFCKNLTNSKQWSWSATSCCSLRQTAGLPIDFSSSTLLTLVFDLTVKLLNSLKWKKTSSAKVKRSKQLFIELVSWNTLAFNQRCTRTDVKGRMDRERHHSCRFEFGAPRPSFFTLLSWCDLHGTAAVVVAAMQVSFL